jgi:hypothetical protein
MKTIMSEVMMLWGRSLTILNGMSHPIPHHQSHPICPILIMGHPISYEWDALAQDGTSHLTPMGCSDTRWDVPSYMNGMLWHKMGRPILHKWDALAEDETSHLTQMGCSDTRWDVPSYPNGMLWHKMGRPILPKWDALTQDGTSHLIYMWCSSATQDVPCCEVQFYCATSHTTNIQDAHIHCHHLEAVGQ